ncbi:MAG: hypothetical protein ACFB14_15475 [Leptolyngbyaceae cyanobacterium]
MMTTLTMVGPFILFAWVLQFLLNQLIADDLEVFDTDQAQPDNASPS